MLLVKVSSLVLFLLLKDVRCKRCKNFLRQLKKKHLIFKLLMFYFLKKWGQILKKVILYAWIMKIT